MSIGSFKQYLNEAASVAYFTFGRMNPPTIGHEKLLDQLSKKSGSNDYFVYVSQTQDKKSNPLAYSDKVKNARKMFPKHARRIMIDKNVRTVFDAATSLYDSGYKNLVMVVGSDRVQEFKTLLNKYNGVKGRHGFYNFESIGIESAGARDPDSAGVEGMSASKQREHARNNDFASFSQGVTKTMSNRDARKLFNDVRKGMGLSEQTDFKRHIELEPVSEEREKYVKGNLFELGDTVRINESDQTGKIAWLGSNYVVVNLGEDKTVRKWITDICKVDEAKKSLKDMKPPMPKREVGDRAAKGVTPPFHDGRDIKSYRSWSKIKKVRKEALEPIQRAKNLIDKEKNQDKKKHDRMLDRARLKTTRMKNKEQ